LLTGASGEVAGSSQGSWTGESVPFDTTFGDTRSVWATRVVDALQAFAGRYVLDGPAALPGIDHFIANLPPPPDGAASVLLDGLVARLREGCAAADRAPVAARAAIHLRAHFSEPLDVRSLARMLGCGATSLQRAFRRDVGTTLREFHARARVCEALTMIASGGKVSVAAAQTGYRSDKDLSRAVRRVAGITPAAVRRLPSQEVQALLAVLRPRIERVH
jgi:AraC-like DNA-binding protein